MSRAELAAALGLRSPGVHRWLRVLRREGYRTDDDIPPCAEREVPARERR